LKYSRQIKYYYLRFIRLRGDPRELALGAAFGIFAGMTPIMPYQTALAVTLALFFKVSKITAALATWVSNPLNWYLLYRFSYKIGASILGFSEKEGALIALMGSIQQAEGAMVVVGKIAGAGSAIISSFLLGGFVMGLVVAIPSYFMFLRIFRSIRGWREKRRDRKRWRKLNP
jgi:hypothetical protein